MAALKKKIRGRVLDLLKGGIKTKELFAGKGCDDCRDSGYVGRIGIYELLVIDDKFRDMINKDASVNNMRSVFRKSGQLCLFDDGLKKVEQGLTTIEEVLRVTEVCNVTSETNTEKSSKSVPDKQNMNELVEKPT